MEYQYYEFAALDRPLTRSQMEALRAVSSRGQINAGGFVNRYHWGNLKADPVDWLQRYFDAFVYSAYGCSCQFMLRLPLAALAGAQLQPFALGDAFSIRASGAHWLIDWSLDESENYERFASDDGSGWMQRLAPLRTELLHGDLRALYLGWLAAASRQRPEDGATTEPAPPPGLAQLSAAQQDLAEFLEIDPDLLAAAALADDASAASPDAAAAHSITAWIEQCPRAELAALVALLAQGQSGQAGEQLRARHAAWLHAQRPQQAAAAARRTLAQLRALAGPLRAQRLAREAHERAQQQAQQQRQRETRLRNLMDDVERCWAAIEAQAERGTGAGYELATRAIVELSDAYKLTSARQEFDRALRALLARHSQRGALLRRLGKAGLLPE